MLTPLPTRLLRGSTFSLEEVAAASRGVFEVPPPDVYDALLKLRASASINPPRPWKIVPVRPAA
jgi:hypothetical protein